MKGLARDEQASCHSSGGPSKPSPGRQLLCSSFSTDQRLPSIEKSFQKVGLPLAGDGNAPDAPAMGLFHFKAAIDKRSRRISALQSYLSKKIAQERSDRLTICQSQVNVGSSCMALIKFQVRVSLSHAWT